MSAFAPWKVFHVVYRVLGTNPGAVPAGDVLIVARNPEEAEGAALAIWRTRYAEDAPVATPEEAAWARNRGRVPGTPHKIVIRCSQVDFTSQGCPILRDGLGGLIRAYDLARRLNWPYMEVRS